MRGKPRRDPPDSPLGDKWFRNSFKTTSPLNPFKGNNKVDPDRRNLTTRENQQRGNNEIIRTFTPKKQPDISEKAGTAHKLYRPNSSEKFGLYSLFFRIVGLCFAVNVLMNQPVFGF